MILTDFNEDLNRFMEINGHFWVVLTTKRGTKKSFHHLTPDHPEGPARHLDVSGQKLSPHCLETIFDSQLPSPKSSPKMPPKLSLPHRRGHFFLFQNYPCGEGNCEAIERQKLSRGNFCPGTSRCLAGPTGHGRDSRKAPEILKVIHMDAAFVLTVGSFLLTVELIYLRLCLRAFLLTVGAFLLTIGASLLTMRKCV